MGKTRKALPDRSLLLSALAYDPTSGLLTWRKRDPSFSNNPRWTEALCDSWNRKHAGQGAHTILRHGYVGVTILGVHYMAHRIIWMMVHGIDPDHIDHINGNKADNRLANLRNVDATGNQRNRKVNANSSTGHSGVSWCRTTNRYVARIKSNGITKMLGRFKNIEDAIAARRAAELALDFAPRTHAA